MTNIPETTAITTNLRDGWLQIVFNMPESRNALSDKMVADIKAVLNAVRDDRSVRGISFRGNGGVFCAGGDLKGFRSIHEKGVEAKGEAESLSKSAGEFFAMIADMPQITIALVEGAAMAGGFGVACCCDIITSTTNAKYALTETRIGITPAQIAPYILARLGAITGKRMMLLGSRFDGKTAHELGLVDYTVDTPDALTTIEDKIKSETFACAPNAVAVTKEIIRQVQSGLPTDEFIKVAANAFANGLTSNEGREGIASFLEKRHPKWAE
ncbi:enoyl-CoA hydratase/isomerase family protein [Kordiimonas sp. SCSIO 12610]|uniref:enoyl-CoA hydratase/isomerase family protein n=1 Tax=Kordiimonas sp. SCSIO 12610 TaxID=2829597 RepID=UPI00210A1BB0|nr:enoyl-CoA hydratase/isomerase family protein [Kordiimonas sp. SCSIO 12610]UTW54769.1 enoyl-CoA hydratase/isomerase family protein [Kordiimonas sp. SCSIO 12610]